MKKPVTFLGKPSAVEPYSEVWTLALRGSQREQLTKVGALELTAKADVLRRAEQNVGVLWIFGVLICF